MATNLALDEALLNEALSLSDHRTKRETVNEALQEYIQRRKQRAVVEDFGSFDIELDEKAIRRPAPSQAAPTRRASRAR